MKLEHYVYYHRDPRPEYFGWKRYIGKGKDNRAFEFDNRSAKHKNWIRHLKSLELLPIVEIFMYFYDSKSALNKEKELIAKYRLKKYELCNIHEGGTGGSTGPCSEKKKKKLSESNKLLNRKLPEWHRKALSDAAKTRKRTEKEINGLIERNKKRMWTEKSKKKLSEVRKGSEPWNKGGQWSEEVRRNISEGLKRKKQSKVPKKIYSKPIMHVETGIIYSSITKAALDLNMKLSTIIALLKGRNKKSRSGNSFQYV